MSMWVLKRVASNFFRTVYIIKLKLSGNVVEDFELAKRHYVHTINTTTTAAITNNAKDIKAKLLGNL